MHGFHMILILDDEELARKQVRQALLSSGIPVRKIIECERGEEALRLLRVEKADIVFTDIQMPVMNGFDFVTELNTLPQKPLVVVMTKYNYFSYAVEMLRLGVKDYLLKPLTRDKVTVVLKRLLEELGEDMEVQRFGNRIRSARLQEFMLSGASEELAVSYGDFGYELLNRRYRLVCCRYESSRIEEIQLLHLWDDKEQDVFVVGTEEWEQQREYFRDCTIGISGLYEGALQLHTAYLDAWEARRNAFFDRNHIMRNAAYFLGEREKPDVHIIEQAVNMIGTDRLEESIQLIKGLIRMVSTEQCEIELFEDLMDYFVVFVSKVYQNVLKEADMDAEEIRNIYRFQNCQIYQDRLTDWMRRLNSIIENRFGDYKNKQKIQQALSYIHENYNKNLNMAVVTNYISMNYSLFSYSFKQYTGSNFVDYLKNLRVNEAKKLLTETDMLIMDISKAVGYDNEKHFTKVFKAECGVSPSEYRKNTLYRKQ